MMEADAGPERRVVRRVEAGAGEPAVVLEAGAKHGGGSAPAPGLATIDRQIDDPASVITGLAAGPCVLAGHSWGGILVQLLAFRRPDLAAGLVLVDPGHEEMESGLPVPLQLGMRAWRAAFRDELRDDVP